MVPPVPAHLTGLYPLRVGNLTGRRQLHGEGVERYLLVVTGNHEVTPRERTLAVGARYVVGGLSEIHAAVAAEFLLKWTRREYR